MKRATIRKPPLDFGGETLGQRLTRLRNQRGYTQVEFAKKVGITQVLVSSYETDRRQFSVEMAIRLALALDISTDELLHPKARKVSSKKPSRRVMRRGVLISKREKLRATYPGRRFPQGRRRTRFRTFGVLATQSLCPNRIW
jgi:transcriptional regulator with XRE-family HTH domain